MYEIIDIITLANCSALQHNMGVSGLPFKSLMCETLNKNN